MKRSFFRFTLIEMLGVIAIIAILAGIAIPVVFIARAKGRETQAKNDINAILVALKSADKDYGRMIGTGNKFLNKDASDPDTDGVVTVEGDTFYAMILELNAPNKDISFALNKRKKNYLEAKKTLDPTATATAGHEKNLYQDPWGNPYIVKINTKKSGKITVGESNIAADVAVYSWGPNGTNNYGCHADLDTCITKDDKDNHKDHDDIASWNF